MTDQNKTSSHISSDSKDASQDTPLSIAGPMLKSNMARHILYASVVVILSVVLSAVALAHLQSKIMAEYSAQSATRIREMDENISRLNGQLRDQINKSAQESRDSIIQMLAKDAAPVGNSAAVGSKQVAAGQRALDLGTKALEAGETDKAMLYFMNGVNHDPSRMELVQRLAEAALNSGDSELGERAVGILELTTMQVSPDDTEAVLDLIAGLRAKFAPPSLPKLSPEDADERVLELCETYAPDAIWSDADKVASALSEIEFFQQMIDISRTDENDDGYLTAIRKSDELAAELQHIQANFPLYQYVNNCIAQMESIEVAGAPDVARFASVSASANGVLAQMWGGVGLLPNGMQAALNSFPAQMREIEENLQNKTSTAPYNEAISLLDRAKADQTGTFTKRIDRVAKAVEDAANKAEAITSSKLRASLFDRMKETREHLVQFEIYRRAAYQTWALGCVDKFMMGWNRYPRPLHPNWNDAQWLFNEHHISEIDETLLVPEVARVLGRVMTCVTGKGNATEASQIEYQMASTKKKRLEDF